MQSYATTIVQPRPKKSLTRRVLTPLVAGTILFYGVSLPAGYVSLQYRDFLADNVPLGSAISDLIDDYELSQSAGAASTGKPALAGGKARETELTRVADSKARAEGWTVKKGEKADPLAAQKDQLVNAKRAAEAAAAAKAKAAAGKVQEAEERAKQAASATIGAASRAKDAATTAAIGASTALVEAKDSVLAAVAPAKANEVKETLPIFAQRPRELDATPIPAKKANLETYAGPPLPIGFEPPPGYALARPPPTPKGDIKPATPPPAPLPLVAPAVKEAASSEPILGQLAATIDSLAKFVETSSDVVSSSATGVLTAAQADIKKLASHINAVKKAEAEKLKSQLDKQAGEYSSLLMKQEKELVERLDTQEEDWKKAFDGERNQLVDAYKVKLELELKTQQELINERLREEVINQGIELQRRWVEEVKTRVEEERGGRLAKLEELEGGLRQLEQVTKANEDVISEAVQSRKVFAAVKAIEHAVSSGKPFDAELRALQKLVPAGEGKDKDSLLALVLSSIAPETQAAGIASFPALATRFQNSVAPSLKRAALLPEHGGIFAYLSSYVASSLLFEKEGWAEGDDVVSVVARAKFWLEAKDLDKAAREVNQLQGWPKALSKDWLNQARSHLEVKQALEVAEAEVTAGALKAI